MVGRPTYEEVCSRLYYDNSSGKLFWRDGRRKFKEAGSLDKGYLRVRFGPSKLRIPAHILVWFMYHKQWPDGFIDHIDRDRTNNRVSNLRVATNSQNQFNRPSKNIYRASKGNSWRVRVEARGTKYNFGSHVCFGKAWQVSQEAQCKLQGDFKYG